MSSTSRSVVLICDGCWIDPGRIDGTGPLSSASFGVSAPAAVKP